MIPLSEPHICGNEKKYVVEALDAGWVSTGGAFINRFELEFADYLCSEEAVACQSGTSGLHLCLVEANVGSGDMVIVPTLTFIAAVNVTRYVNAEPIFIGCDDSLCIDPNKVEDFIEFECDFDGKNVIYKNSKKQVKAIIVVHVFGNMCDMLRIMEIAKKYNLTVIEDATEALGTKYTSGVFENAFSGCVGDYGVFSFNGNKIITTGGGGMIVARDKGKLRHIKYLSSQAKNDTVKFIHNEVGYNYRMTNVQAAIGLGQLEMLEKFIEAKNNNYKKYFTALGDAGISMLKFRNNVRSNCWFYSIYLDDEYSIEKRNILISSYHDYEIYVRPIWGLIHKQLPYVMCIAYGVEKALGYERRVINIPCSVNLTQEQLYKVVDVSRHLICK